MNAERNQERLNRFAEADASIGAILNYDQARTNALIAIAQELHELNYNLTHLDIDITKEDDLK